MRRMFATMAVLAMVSFGTDVLAIEKVQIGDGKVSPESFAALADGTIYAGSLGLGQIFKAAAGATKAEVFIDKPADGPTSITGVYADLKDGLLWACYSDLAAFSGKAGLPAIARAYDLQSGALKTSFSFPGPSFCNDFVTTPDGMTLVTDTVGSRILAAGPGATTLQEWLVDKTNLGGIDGITLSPDGKLYVNNVVTSSLYRIEIKPDGTPGALTKLTTSEPLKGPDGMRFGSDGVLYLAENGAGRADSVALDGDNATITPLVSNLDAPTAVDKPGSYLWVLESRMQAGTGPYYIIPVPSAKP